MQKLLKKIISQAPANVKSKDVARIYDLNAGSFYEHRLDDAIPFWTLGFPAIIEALGAKIQGANLLDVGCGSGRATKKYIDMGAASATGVDISREELVLAQQHYQNIPNLHFGFFDLENPDSINTPEHVPLVEINAASFDVIIASYVLCHVSNHVQSLQSIYSLLKPSGLFLMMEPHEDRFQEYYDKSEFHNGTFHEGAVLWETWPGASYPVPMHYRHNKTQLEALQEAGFLQENITSYEPRATVEEAQKYPNLEPYSKMNRIIIYRCEK